MATSKEFIEFVLEQVRGDYPARYKKMFGEYMVYINDKPLLLVCDNTVYVKMSHELDGVIDKNMTGIPYGGAKEHYILDVENHELTKRVIEILEPITALPKKKKR